jgi:hypothetical protein
MKQPFLLKLMTDFGLVVNGTVDLRTVVKSLYPGKSTN